MSRLAKILPLGLWLVVALTPRASAQPSPAETPIVATVAQRADALLGLARVARAREQWREAHEKFTESARLRPLDPAHQDEHFWIAVHVDRPTALRLARSLADQKKASRDVLARWIALLADDEAIEPVLDAVDVAAAVAPGDPHWTSTRAALAMRAEHAGQAGVAARAWSTVPESDREAHAEWQASLLRVSAALTSRAALATGFDRYVQAHPSDIGMRLLAVEAWADAGQPRRGLDLLTPTLGRGAAAAQLRRGADLARQGGDASRARALFERLLAEGTATDEDRWALATLLAADHDSASLRRLFVTYPPPAEPCASRIIDVLIAAGDDALLADLVPALPVTCRTHAPVAPRIAAVLMARGRPADAEAWLAPMARAGTLDDAGSLVLARALSARAAWHDVDALLSDRIAGRQDAYARDAARLLVWAWHAQGQSTEAWALAARLLAPQRDSADAQAGWATIALAAGEPAIATQLASAAVGSARDVDARAVLAAIGAAAGRSTDVRRWLDPVHASLTNPGHVLLWLDASDALDGPVIARRDAAAYAAIVDADATLRARRALWAAASGDASAAAADAAAVRGMNPELAGRLDISLALIREDVHGAWQAVTTVDPDDVRKAPAAWGRLRLDAAIASRHWAEADLAMHDLDRALAVDERVLVSARLRLGREGSLDDSSRAGLDRLIAEGRHVRAASVVLAADLVATRAYAAALARLPFSVGAADAGKAGADVRSVAAEALLGLGRAADVLQVVSDAPTEPIALQVVRARAQIALGHGDEARARLEALSAATGRADVALAWAGALEQPAARAVVLQEALSRHPDNLDLRLRHADALRLAGALAAARTEADALLRDAPVSHEAWRVLVAIESTARAEALGEVLVRARDALGTDPDVVLMLAEAVAQAPQVTDAGVDVVTAWLAAVPESHALRAARVQAALGVASGRWAMAQDAIRRLQVLAPSATDVMRLHAEVTAWSGEHAAAVPLFEAYLQREPADAAAWRQYARLLTWQADRDGAARAYARAQALTPTAALDAEARTRLAVLERAWPRAAGEATRWRQLEPATLDALVNLALALEQAGDVAGAARAYDDLARWPGLPETVRRTVSAYEWRRAPHGVGSVEVEHSDGFDQQRLLERRETAFSGEAAVTRSGAVRAFGRLGQGRLDTGVDDPGFTQGQAGVRAWIGRGITAEGRLGSTRVAGADAWLGGVRLAVPVSAHLAIEGGTARSPFWENDATVSSGLQVWTSGVRLRTLGTGTIDASVGADYGVLSDGLHRQQVDASVGRQLNRGPRQFEVRASAFLLGFNERTSAYFSPSAFGRLDVEAAVLQWCGQGAAVRDGRFALRGRVGSGVDTDGVPYVLAGGGFVVPLAGPLALAGEGRWTSSRVYQAWTGTVGLRVGTGGGQELPSRTR